MINIKKAQKLTILILAAAAAEFILCVSSFAQGSMYWEGNSTSDPTNVEPISGTEFAAYNAFTDWQQTQSVLAGAGLSVGAKATAGGGIGNPVTQTTIYLGNFQNTSQTNIHVNAGSYVAITFGTVGADFSVSINSTYVSDYHADYYETNASDHTGYIVVYFKLKDFTVNYGTNSSSPTINIADIYAGTINGTGMDIDTVDHKNFIDGLDDPNGNFYVSSGLLDSTPEIPPQAIPAVYGGLSLLLMRARGRFGKKKGGKK